MRNANDYILIHGAVPTHETLKSKLANDAYEWGHESFLVDGIPFSKYQSRTYANLIAKLIAQKAKLNPSDTDSKLYIYEFGAGSGLLALGILNQLKSKYPNVYRRVHLQISDISDANLRDMRAFDMFKDHADHIELRVADFLKSDFFRDEAPFFIYCTYLVDALPSLRIVIDNGVAYEILTETYLAKSAEVIDVSQEIPGYLRGEDILPILADSAADKRRPIRYQVGRQLLENYVPRPLAQSPIPADMKQRIIAFAAKHPEAQRSPFSFPFAFFDLLRQLAQHPNITFFCTEVMAMDVEHLQQLPMGRGHINYGLVSYHSLFWPLACEIFEELNLKATVTKRSNGTTAEFILENGIVSLSKYFARWFQPGFDSAANATKPLSELEDTTELKAGLLNLHQTVKGERRLDYSYLNNISGLFQKAGETRLARDYAKILMSYSPSLAVTSYGVFSLIARAKKRYAEERKWLSEGIRLFPQNRLLRALMANYHLRHNEEADSIRLSKSLLKLVEKQEITGIMLQVALLYLRIQDKPNARLWIDAILNLEQNLQNPSENDLEVFQKVKTLISKVQ